MCCEIRSTLAGHLTYSGDLGSLQLFLEGYMGVSLVVSLAGGKEKGILGIERRNNMLYFTKWKLFGIGMVKGK